MFVCLFLCCETYDKISEIYKQLLSWFKSSRPVVHCKKFVLKNFSKLTRRHMCQNHFFNKVTNLRLRTPRWLLHLVSFLKKNDSQGFRVLHSNSKRCHLKHYWKLSRASRPSRVTFEWNNAGSE